MFGLKQPTVNLSVKAANLDREWQIKAKIVVLALRLRGFNVLDKTIWREPNQISKVAGGSEGIRVEHF